MELVRSVADIKKWVSVNASYSPDTLEPSANQVRDIVIDILSPGEYADLVTAYGGVTDTTTAAQKMILPYVQRALITLAMAEHLSTGITEISNAGAHISVSKDRKNLPADLRKEIQDKYCNHGFAALERMLSTLQANSDDFPKWKVSEEKKEHLSSFVNTAKVFQNHYDIGSSFQLFLLMKSSIKEVERDFIYPVLGKLLSAEIKLQIFTNTLTEKNKELLSKINDAIAPLTIYRYVPKNSDKLSAIGISQYSTSDFVMASSIKPTNNSLIGMRIKDAERQGYRAVNALESYLKENASDYPLYEVPAEPEDINTPGKSIFTII